jgi:hypothetical protein
VGTTGIILIMKIVINTCFGGYNLSHEAMLAYCDLKDIQVWPEKDDFYWNYWTVPPETRVQHKPHEEFYAMPLAARKAYNDVYISQIICRSDIERTDPVLVQIVEQLGEAAWGDLSELKVVEVPDDVDWYISEFDGKERVAERHRVWD